ncbi:MAG: glutamate 5-kinase [Planctomycetota bacterium]
MPSTPIREDVLTAARSVVVKIGTQLLTKPEPGQVGGVALDARFIGSVAGQVAKLRARGVRVTLVSSGAIGAGCAALGMAQRPTDVAEAQAVAAVGQRNLMTAWHTAFTRRKLGVGQVLLTRSDFDDRGRFLNIRNCVSRLYELDCVPILNENDAVAVEELRFGDNDVLAGLTTNALRADALLMLTVVDGLLDDDGQVIDRVDDVVGALSAVRAEKSGWGSGGMASKLEAARVVTEAGEVAVVANGRSKDVVLRLLDGEAGIGTVFAPAARKLDARSRWIGLTVRPAGAVTVDGGAADAVTQHGKSLLAKGITAMTGRFERGDVLLVRDAAGKELGRGLTNYASDELRLILGRHSDEFEQVLGRPGYTAVVHRDHLVLLGS